MRKWRRRGRRRRRRRRRRRTKTREGGREGEGGRERRGGGEISLGWISLTGKRFLLEVSVIQPEKFTT